MYQDAYREASFELYENFESYNLIQGTLQNNCKIDTSEILTQKYLDNDEKYKKIFEGFFVKIEFPQDFGATLYLRKDIKDKTILEGSLFLKKLPFDDLRIKFDNPNFEKKFDIYCDNENLALKYMSFDIIQYFMQFYNETDMQPELTIKRNCLYLRFNSSTAKDNLPGKKTLYGYFKVFDFSINLTNKLLKIL